MSILYKVLHYSHVLLKKKSTDITNFTPQLREFVQNLIATAIEFEGGGIAAPQVGVNKRIFVADFSKVFEDEERIPRTPDDFLVYNDKGEKIDPKFPMTFINPVFIEKNQPIVTNWEGCLSFPNAESFDINRYHDVFIEAHNEWGEKFRVKTTHLYASVNFQHETDHLDGILMIDRWNKKDFNEKNIISDIKNFAESSEQRKRIKKLKLLEASKIKFDFL